MGCSTSSGGGVTGGSIASEAPGSSSAEKVTDHYVLGEMLGEGSFATVLSGTHKVTGEKRAIKVIDKAAMKKAHTEIKDEIDILLKCGNHANIIHLYDVYHDPKNYYLVMELCSGGDLFGKIVSDGCFSEKSAAQYCRQLAEALQYMHEQGVTHRDLKPENLLLKDNSDDAPLKLADFGLSKLVGRSDDTMKTVCGTWAYAAPEVISHKSYHMSVDTWSLGVLQYVLLGGYHPFDVYGDLPEPTLLRRIVDCKFDFNDDVWENISTHAKELIKNLLKVDPDERMTLEQYLADPWVHPPGTHDHVVHNEDTHGQFIERLNKHTEARAEKKKAKQTKVAVANSVAE